MSSAATFQVASFATDLGWIAVVGAGSTVRQLVFGYPNEAAALASLNRELFEQARLAKWCPALVVRLKEYAAGRPVDLSDVQIDLEHLTLFQQRVVKRCRAIGYGRTSSYGALARAAGSVGAARAVGNTMAANRYPLLVPCHRVINSDGSIGQFSSPDGPSMKARLLNLEQGSGAVSRRPSKKRAASAC
jgi:methylated-DNA-[protein]-cysteine S-methyltransferase